MPLNPNRERQFAHRGGNTGQISRTAIYCLPHGWKCWPNFANRSLLFAHRGGNIGQISRTAIYCLPTGVEILARFREPQFTVCPQGWKYWPDFANRNLLFAPRGWKCWPNLANRSLLFPHRDGNAGQISRTAVYCLPTGVEMLARFREPQFTVCPQGWMCWLMFQQMSWRLMGECAHMCARDDVLYICIEQHFVPVYCRHL